MEGGLLDMVYLEKMAKKKKIENAACHKFINIKSTRA